jgi:nitrate reductase gamma subunit
LPPRLLNRLMALQIFLYAACAIFLAGNIYRLVRVARMPAHLRWELYPIPRGARERQLYGGSYFEESEWWTKPPESSRVGEVRVMLEEIFLLMGVWKNFRGLWVWSWLLHAGLYALIASAVFTFATIVVSGRVESAAGGLASAARILPWIGVCAGLAGVAGLLVMRAATPRLRPYSSRSTFFHLLFLLGIFATGLAGLVIEPAMPGAMRGLAGAMLGLNVMPALPAITAAHAALLGFFLTYFPFTHLTHAYMKFFTYHSVRWDDRPAARDPRAVRSVARSLERTLTWSAPHIAAPGAQTWADAVADKGTEVEQKP